MSGWHRCDRWWDKKLACPFGGELPEEEDRDRDREQSEPHQTRVLEAAAVAVAGATRTIHDIISADADVAQRVASRTALGTMVPLRVMDGIRGVPMMPGHMLEALALGAEVVTPAGVPNLVQEALGAVMPWQEVLAHVTNFGNTGWVARSMAVSSTAQLAHTQPGYGWQESAGLYGAYGALSAAAILQASRVWVTHKAKKDELTQAMAEAEDAIRWRPRKGMAGVYRQPRYYDTPWNW